MKIEYFKEYSHIMGRNMEFKVHGHQGKPCIAFPSQNERFYDYEDKGIINSLSWYIEQGKIQIFCVDANYDDSFSAKWKNPKDRIDEQERYYKYIVEEFVPRVYEINSYSNNKEQTGIMTYGVSLGAYEAMNFFLRRPDIFDGVLALSGIYHSGYLIENYADDKTYFNSPIDCLNHMPLDHPYIELYKKARIIVCVGQGAYEEECLKDTRGLDNCFKNLKIDAMIDYWGYEKPHDWPSWIEQTPHFMYYILD